MKNFVKSFVLSMGLVLGAAASLYSQDFSEKDFKLSGGAVENVKMKAVDGNFDKKATDLGIGAAKISKVVPSTNGADGGEKGLSQHTEQQVSSQQSAKQSESWTNNTGIFSRYHANKWTANGIYAGLTPEKEQIQYRTEHSKTFDNGDGTFSYMYIGDLHYQDEKGSWQDIDVSIKKENNNGYKYANTTNKFKTYYSDSPADGIMMNYEGQNLVFGKNNSFSFIDGQGNALAGQERTAANAKQDDFRTLSYKDFYRGIDYKMIQLGRGVETGFFVNNRSAVADGANTVRVSQTVEMPDVAYIMADGHKQSKTFCASEFEIMIPGYESWITFQPVVVYDANVDMDYIMKRAEIRHIEDNVAKDGKPLENPMDKYSYKAKYNVEMQGRILTVSFDIPAEWLLADNRAYPVFIDPTVTVLTGTATAGNAHEFYDHYFHDSRWDFQLSSSELSSITDGATITAMGLLCYERPTRDMANSRIDLNNAAWSTSSWVSSGWQTCYGPTSISYNGLNTGTTTWNNYTFTSAFIYSSVNNNLLVRLTKDDSGYESNAGGNYLVTNTSVVALGNYSDSNDGNYPFTFSASTITNNTRPAMQLTYTSQSTPAPSCDVSINMSNLSQALECGRTYCFYDSGGANGDYAINQNYTATFTSTGNITINFSSFVTESASNCNEWDYIKIYDGGTNGTLLVSGQTGCSTRTLNTGTDYTATSGTMTVVWKSDGSNNAAGWVATISTNCNCASSDLSIAMGGEASLESDGRYYYDVCLGDPVNMVGVVNEGTAASWRWYINSHNGTPDVFTQQSPTYTPDVVHGYDITLTARDENGCPATAYGRIRVSGGLTVPAQVSPAANGVCQGSERVITIGDGANSEIQVARESYEVTATLGESNVTFIPDGPNCASLGQCYESPVTFNDFSDAATITSANDIKYVKLNMEHSHIGDMQIKLVCPNGQSAIILQDAYGTSSGGLDNATYDWPYNVIHFEVRYALYENAAGAGGCSRGGYLGNTSFYGFVVYKNGVYSVTGVRQEATAFPVGTSTATLHTHLINAINSGNTPSDFCYGEDYYLVFDSYYHTLNGYSAAAYYELGDFVGNYEIEYVYEWGIDAASLGFGSPNLSDALSSTNVCNAAYNNPGTEAEYCWSNSTSYGYGYASGGGYVTETTNHTVGQTNGMMVIPSNTDNMTQIYHPYQNFSSLAGCPLNGTWKIQVCDSWNFDNGYVFSWELALKEDFFPDPWDYDVYVAGTEVTPSTYGDDGSTGSGAAIVIHPPSNATGNQHVNVTVIDNLGCRTDSPIEVDFAVTPSINAAISGNLHVCQGSGTTLTAGVTGSNPGVAPFTYHWNNNFANSTLSTGNLSGDATYSVTVTDASGCVSEAETTVLISNPQLSVSHTDACYGQNNGTATVTVTNTDHAVGIYRYAWAGRSAVETSSASNTITGLAPNTYRVTVTDITSGCSATASITVEQLSQINVSASSNSPICSGNTATVNAGTISGGASPYTYSWNGGTYGTSTSYTTSTLTSSYTVTLTVKDNNGCTALTTAPITVNPRPTATVSGGGEICNGDNSTFTITFTGVAPYSYTWSDGSHSTTATLNSGNSATITVTPSVRTTYTVTSVSDSRCGSGTTSGSAVVIVNPKPVLSSISALPTTVCPGGAVSLGASLTTNGTPNYTYTWSTSPTGMSLATTTTSATTATSVSNTATAPTGSSVCGNTYAIRLHVQDNKGCTADATPINIIVNDEVPPTIAVATSSNPNGACNPGTITAPTFTYTDNCTGTGTVTNVTTSGPSHDGCAYTQTWTANYTDDCGNPADEVSITYTWTQDDENPVIATTATSGDKGCNPTIEAPSFTYTDNCSGSGTVTNVTTS
ncbi:MAG: proprotein convertase P-domain-containing protein, partial [Bacteroidales bacterium]|nr:proprotein convertase P-domain-containing protein [Bacteroidales bacterium]